VRRQDSIRAWKSRLRKRSYGYAVQLQYRKQRRWVRIPFRNETDAAEYARDAAEDLRFGGWDAIDSPSSRSEPPSTVGVYLAQAESFARVRPRTWADYRRAVLLIAGSPNLPLNQFTKQLAESWMSSRIAGVHASGEIAKRKRGANSTLAHAKSAFADPIRTNVIPAGCRPRANPLQAVRAFATRELPSTGLCVSH